MAYKLKDRNNVETVYSKDKLKIPADTGEGMIVFSKGEAEAEKRKTIVLAGFDDITPDSGFDFMGKANVFVVSEYAELQNPTGNMQTYEGGAIEFDNEVYPVNSFVIAAAAFNTIADYGNPPITMWIKATVPSNPMQDCEIITYSETSGTLTSAFFENIFGDLWTFGDVAVAKGWDLIDVSNGAMATAAISLSQANSTLGPIPLNPLPAFDLAAMDAYQKSFYKVGGIAHESVSPHAASIVCGESIAGVDGTATITSILKMLEEKFAAGAGGMIVSNLDTPTNTIQDDKLIGAKDFLVIAYSAGGSIAAVVGGAVLAVYGGSKGGVDSYLMEDFSAVLDAETGTITVTAESGDAPTFFGTYFIFYM